MTCCKKDFATCQKYKTGSSLITHHFDYYFLPIIFCWLFLPIIICHIHSHLCRYIAAIRCLTTILATAFGGPDKDCTNNVSALEWKVSRGQKEEERKYSAWQWLHPWILRRRNIEMFFLQKKRFMSLNICHTEKSHFWKSVITIDLKALQKESFRTLCHNFETKAINPMS